MRKKESATDSIENEKPRFDLPLKPVPTNNLDRWKKKMWRYGVPERLVELFWDDAFSNGIKKGIAITDKIIEDGQKMDTEGYSEPGQQRSKGERSIGDQKEKKE